MKDARRHAGAIVLASFAVGVAAWLSPASIHITSWPRSGPARIALFAPLQTLWWAMAGSAAAAAAIWFAGRSPLARARSAYVVAPLAILWLWALPFATWLPDRLPLLLLLAGPLRWVVAAAALLAVGVRLARPAAWRWPLQLPGTRTVFAVSLVLYLVLGFRSLRIIGLGGDEPHYLVIAHSLMADGDLKIENNHAQRDYRAFFGGELRPDYMRRGTDGEIYSIHAPGLPAVVLPGYALAGARGALVIACLLAALAAAAIFGVASRVGGGAIAWLTWASVCLTVPFIPHAWAIYPEIAGAAIVAAAVWWLVSPMPASAWVWVARGACMAALPWLHTKFLVLLAGLVMPLLLRLRLRMSHGAAFFLPIGVSGIAWLVSFYILYGSFDPQAPYGSYPAQFIKMENVPRSLIGLLFDQKFGLLVYAPVYALAVAGAWFALRDQTWRGLAAMALAITAAYAIGSARLYMWWGGSSAPARFLVPLIPLIAPLVAVGLVRLRETAATAVVWSSLALSLLVAAAGVAGFDRLLLFSDPHGSARIVQMLQGSAPLAAALPTFTEPDWPAPLARLWPWLGAAMAALACGRLVAGWLRASLFWTAAAQAVTFLLVAATLAGPFSSEARTDSVAGGRLALITRFDPQRLRAFDYARMIKVAPPEWLRAATVAFERDQTLPADPIGRVTGPLLLPTGRYEARVWFQGQQARDGHFQVALGQGHLLARVEGPLPNPTVMAFDMPLPIPALWLQLTEQSAAQAVMRVELSAISIVPESERLPIDVRAVEAIAGRSNAYMVYVDRYTFPEGGVFWTRGTGRGEVLVAPAGARQIVLTLHVGPNGGTVHLTIGGRSMDVPMQDDETRQVVVEAPAGAPWVSISVEASAAFVPAAVDRQSSDTRTLGCQVRVEVQ